MTILTVTLNPAIDATYVVPRFHPGTSTRAIRKHEMPGGKGNNVARLLASRGHRVTAAGFLAGATGQKINQGLSHSGVTPAFTWLDRGESRTCHAILEEETGRVSEVLEPGPEIPAEDADRFLHTLPGILTGIDTVVLSGSAPPGLTPDWLDDLGRVLRTCPRFIVDSSGVTLETLLRHRPCLIKPNRHEMRALIGHDATLPDMIDFAQTRLCDEDRSVLLSLGEEGACLITSREWWMVRPPEGLPIVNTVGCGDALLAGFIHGWQAGESAPKSLETAVAFASAAAQEEMAGIAQPEHTEHARKQLTAFLPECLNPIPAGRNEP